VVWGKCGSLNGQVRIRRAVGKDRGGEFPKLCCPRKIKKSGGRGGAMMEVGMYG